MLLPSSSKSRILQTPIETYGDDNYAFHFECWRIPLANSPVEMYRGLAVCYQPMTEDEDAAHCILLSAPHARELAKSILKSFPE